MVRVKISARALKTVDKCGGLDGYLLGGGGGSEMKMARLRELGTEGWRLRWAVLVAKGLVDPATGTVRGSGPGEGVVGEGGAEPRGGMRVGRARGHAGGEEEEEVVAEELEAAARRADEMAGEGHMREGPEAVETQGTGLWERVKRVFGRG